MHDYQEFVISCLHDRATLGRPLDVKSLMFEMVGEFGEAANAYKHAHDWPDRENKEEEKAHLKEELGDLLWYIFAVCSVLGYDVSEVASENAQKLMKRRAERSK